MRTRPAVLRWTLAVKDQGSAQSALVTHRLELTTDRTRKGAWAEIDDEAELGELTVSAHEMGAGYRLDVRRLGATLCQVDAPALPARSTSLTIVAWTGTYVEDDS